jgi:hypothetical protein
MRRLFILWSAVRPSKIQLFGETASFGFDHLSSIAIWADDASEKVAPEEIEVRPPTKVLSVPSSNCLGSRFLV